MLSNRSLADPSNIRFLLVYTPFRPVVNVSYGLDRFLWGPAPFGFHVTSVALHAVASMLFCVLLQRLLWDAGARRWSGVAAFAGAALFAVHPLQTEAVGYVSGRSELLCAVWVFASVLAARRAVTTGSAGAGAAALACGLVAVASKEVALVLPLIVLTYAWLLPPVATGASGEAHRRENASAPAVTSRRLVPLFLTAAVVLIAAGMYRLAAFGFLSGGTDLYTSVLNALTQTIVIWRYVALLVWPHGQSIMHAVHRVTSPADPLALAALAGLAVVVAVAVTSRRSAPLLTLGVLWFLAVLAPSSSIIPLREGMAEHRVYLASAGFFLVVAQQLARWLEGAAVRAPRVRWAGAAVFSVLVILASLTVSRNRVWSSAVSLWSEATVHAAGMWEPSYALGDSLREAGDCAGAVPAYRTVVDMRPAHRDAHTNLGICLAQTGQLGSSRREFRRALEIDPDFARGTPTSPRWHSSTAMPSGQRLLRPGAGHDSGNVLARLQLASLYEHTFKDYHAAARMCGEARLLAPATPGVAECVQRNEQLAAERDAGRCPHAGPARHS